MNMGDRVENVNPKSKRYGDEGEVTGVRSSDGKFEITYDNGDVGYGMSSSYEVIDSADEREVEIINVRKTTKMKSLVSRLADLFRAEPQKTYRKLGITDSQDKLTSDGVDMFINKLFWVNEETLVRPDAIKLLAEETKDK